MDERRREWEVCRKAGVCLRETSPISSVRVRCKNLQDQAGLSMGRCTSDGVYSLYSVAGIDLDSRDRVDIKVHAKTLGQGST